MTNELVKFPSPGSEWRAVAGPGMYVLAVLPRDLEPDPCAVGCAITLLRPQGKLLNEDVTPWPTQEVRAYDARLLEEAALFFEETGQGTKAAVMRAQFPITDLSVEVVHATRLGTTKTTLKNRKTGEYWRAEWSDLTPSGTSLLHQVHMGFTRAPLILTFLGEEDG